MEQTAEGPLEELMVDTAMENLKLEGTRKEAMTEWKRWTSRAQVVPMPMAELMVGRAKAE